MRLITSDMRALLLIVTLVGPGARAAAEDWTHWRGANRNGIVNEPSGWTPQGWLQPKPAWTLRGTLGEGTTSPLVVGDELFVMGWLKGKDFVHSLRTTDGTARWSVSYACPQYGRHATGDEGLYSGPTSTPEYDEATGYLYTLSCDGHLNCWDTRDRGRHVWGLNLYDRFSIGRRPKVGRSGLRDYGYTTAPLVHGDWVLVEAGAPQGTLAAFTKATGKLAWTSEARGPAGHTGGLVPLQVEGIPCVAAFTFHGLLVTRLDGPQAGQTVAQYEWITEFINNIATPAVYENRVLITSAYNHQAICNLEVSLQGARKVWEQPFASKVCSPIIHEGHIYWAWQRLRCLDLVTGEQQWEGGAYGDAGSCILTSDNRLIVWGGSGTLALVETAGRSPGNYRELARVNHVFAADVWPHVVLSGGRIYCKDREGNLTCLVTTAAP